VAAALKRDIDEAAWLKKKKKGEHESFSKRPIEMARTSPHSWTVA
jgi:hypothetical protein